MPVDCKRYTYRVRWSVEDEEFVATVAEFPSLSWLEGDQGGALDGIVELVREVVYDLASSGEAIPEPLCDRQFSGSIRLRLPPEQHRELAIQAAEEGVSLNRYICSRISMAPAAMTIGRVAEPKAPGANGGDSREDSHGGAEALETSDERSSIFKLIDGGQPARATAQAPFTDVPVDHGFLWQKEG